MSRQKATELPRENNVPIEEIEKIAEQKAKEVLKQLSADPYTTAGQLQHEADADDNALSAEMAANIVCNLAHDRAEEMVGNFLADHGLSLSESQEHMLIESCCRFLASQGATDSAEKLLWDNLLKAMGHGLSSTLSVKPSNEHRDTIVIQTNTASGGVLASQVLHLGLRDASVLHSELAKFIDGAS